MSERELMARITPLGVALVRAINEPSYENAEALIDAARLAFREEIARAMEERAKGYAETTSVYDGVVWAELRAVASEIRRGTFPPRACRGG